MSEKMKASLNELKVLVLCGAMVLTTQLTALFRAGQGADIKYGNIAMGILAIIAISFVAMKIKALIPLTIPAFAWASLLALLLTTPWCPIQGWLLEVTSQIGAGQIGTAILAIAGVSIGMKLNDIRKLSWKMIIIAIVVFIGTFFGSALISELILKAQGII